MKRNVFTFFGVALLAGVGALIVVPLLYTFNASLLGRANFSARQLSPAVPPDPSAYERVARITDLPMSYLTTGAVIAVSVLILWLVAGFAAYNFVFNKGRLRVVLFGALLAGFMIPFQSIINPFFVVMNRLGLANEYHGMVVAFVMAFTPLVTIQLVSYYRGLPREVLEAARVDGASQLRTFFSVVVPMSRPAFASSGILSVILMTGSFLLPVIVITDPTKQMLAVRLGQIRITTGTQPSDEAAGAMLMIIPLLVIYVVTRKHMVRGFTAGSGK